MEGVGSRIGRASSRYGPSATANVFNGPVRKWRKKWVHVSPPPAANHSSHSQSNGHRDNGSRLLLCRWTPLAGSGEGDGSSAAEEPPKRRYRYTPVSLCHLIKILLLVIFLFNFAGLVWVDWVSIQRL
ncbi:hypothetical protein LINPERPRIM_LOCUS5295 [Linum perenne]